MVGPTIMTSSGMPISRNVACSPSGQGQFCRRAKLCTNVVHPRCRAVFDTLAEGMSVHAGAE